MHPALQIPEILNEIFDCFLPVISYDDYANHYKYIPDEPSDKLSLLSAALTCSAFLQPALDHLWWDMDDLTPLFNTIPGFQSSNDTGTLGKIQEPIARETMQRLNAYRKRIHVYEECGKERIEISAYEHILQDSTHDTLLPSLRILSITNSIPQLPLLLAHPEEIRTLRISQNQIQSVDAYIAASLKLLSGRVQTLVHLRLETFLTREFLASAFELRGLRSLYLGHTNENTSFEFDVDTLLDICSMPDLQRIYVDALEDLQFAPRSRTPFKQILRFLSSASLPRLKCLALRTACEADDVQYWNYLFQALVEKTSPMFEDLDLGETSSISWQDYNLTLRDVPELLKLQLRSFTSSGGVFSISSVDILSLISGWPNLRALTLFTCPPTSFKFQTLVDIAKGLPHLGLLALAEMDMYDFPPADSIPILEDHDLFQLLIDPGESGWKIRRSWRDCWIGCFHVCTPSASWAQSILRSVKKR
ncbi:unnamed protein product [Cyclocybe aegerita]|uniref:F-box domain-containing protein n=1 Tax=Cyclocybe aegerita TaxID=1973307 RepID=A0A8S0VVG8_CYCAE|nr:unnamed protein product [Cyclocybe aegerita]